MTENDDAGRAEDQASRLLQLAERWERLHHRPDMAAGLRRAAMAVLRAASGLKAGLRAERRAREATLQARDAIRKRGRQQD